MNARSHDGAYAPAHVIARHTYAETFANLHAMYADMEQEADAAYTEALASLSPIAEGETFFAAGRYPAGWRVVYYDPSPLTRMFAARLARLRRDPRVTQIALFRSKGQPERIAYIVRRFRETEQIASLDLAH
jgi:hypothetical protein